MLHSVSIAIVSILLDLLLGLAIGRIGKHVVGVGRLLLSLLWHLLRRVHRFDTLRRLGDNVFLGALLVGVIGARREEEQRAAQPDLLRIVRQIPHSHPVRRGNHHITRALRAIPVAT